MKDKTPKIVIRGSHDKVLAEATRIMRRIYPYIGTGGEATLMGPQFLKFEKRHDFGDAYIARLYNRDFDDHRGKHSGQSISDYYQVYCTGKLWKAVLIKPRFSSKEWNEEYARYGRKAKKAWRRR